MIAALMSLLLASDPTTYVASQNHFDGSEMGSEAIFAGVAVCMRNTIAAVPGIGEQHAVILCGCLMDATRVNVKAGRRGSEANATAEQEAKCRNLRAPMQKRPPPPTKKPGKAGV